MHPVLRSTLLAFLLAALPAAARAVDPKAAFDLNDREIGITADEKAEILSLEDGRYGYSENRLVDSKQRSILTNQQVLDLLKARAVRLTDDLMAKKFASLTEADKKLGYDLYWTRASLLDKDRIEFLKSLNPVRLNEVRQKPEEGTVTATAGTDLERYKQELYQRLKKNIEFVDDGDPNRAAVADRALKRLMDSGTARELSEQLLAEGGQVKVSFVPVDGSAVVLQNGRKVINASGGNMLWKDGFINLHLNQDLLQTDPAFQDQKITATMGHEMLGHGLLSVRAEKAGVHSTDNAYRGDEAKAGLTGWLVESELGGKLYNGHMWRFLKDPEEYYQGLHTNLPYYAGTFSVEELSDPMPALEERLERVKQSLADNKDYADEQHQWSKRMDHFVSVHGVKEESLKTLRQDVETELKVDGPDRLRRLAEIQKHIEDLLKYYKSPTGQKEIKRMAEDARKPFFTDNEKELKRLRERLADETKGKKQETFFPPVPGQLTWSGLERMYDEDKKEHPEHWK